MGSRWQADALCAGTDPNGWDAEVATERQLADNARLCQRCPVRAECAADALTTPTVRADKSRMLRAGIVCNRRTEGQRFGTDMKLIGVLEHFGYTVLSPWTTPEAIR